MDKQLIWNEAKDYVGITLGLILYSFGFTFFLMPYEIVTGGVAGVAAIVEYATTFPNQFTYFLVNAALLIVGLKILGWKFLVKTIYAILVLTFLLGMMKELVPRDDNGQMIKILGEGQDFMSLIVGCLMTGSALGIVFLNNGSTGGTDIIAASVNKFYNMSLGTAVCSFRNSAPCYNAPTWWCSVSAHWSSRTTCSTISTAASGRRCNSSSSR